MALHYSNARLVPGPTPSNYPINDLSHGWLANMGKKQLAAMAEGRYTGPEFFQRTVYKPKQQTPVSPRTQLRSIFSSKNPRKTLRKTLRKTTLPRTLRNNLNLALSLAKTPRTMKKKTQWWNRLSKRKRGGSTTRRNRS